MFGNGVGTNGLITVAMHIKEIYFFLILKCKTKSFKCSFQTWWVLGESPNP